MFPLGASPPEISCIKFDEPMKNIEILKACFLKFRFFFIVWADAHDRESSAFEVLVKRLA